MSDEEGLDFMAAFQGQFAQREAKTNARLRAERRAGMTPKQRAKRAKKTASLNFRCSDDVRALATALASHFESDLTDVMERAVVHLANSENVRLK